MFEFINDAEITNALAGVHYALRRITHRHAMNDEHDSSHHIVSNSKIQDSSDGLELGSKIIQAIEHLEQTPLIYLPASKASSYKKTLLQIVQRLTKANLNYDSRKGKQLLESWRSNPLENISNLSLENTGIFIGLPETKTIENVLRKALRNKFNNYNPEPAVMPFHTRLLGKDRLALYSFIHSLTGTFGTSVFEPVAVTLAKSNFADAKAQTKAGEYISEGAFQVIQNIMTDLTAAQGTPDKANEIERIRAVCRAGKMINVKPTKIDVFVEAKDGELFLFDIKTAKPNAGNFKEFKRTLLEWVAAVLADAPDAKVNSLIAIPYNPYAPQPYNRWTMRGMLDLPNELKVAEEFWDFLGGAGAYNDLLDIFERVGIELRSEIDEYFLKFNLK